MQKVKNTLHYLLLLLFNTSLRQIKLRNEIDEVEILVEFIKTNTQISK